MDKRLTIELVPKTSWYSNVRSNVSKSEWDVLRKASYKKANHQCEICGDVGTNQGFRHKVECHEIWHYDSDRQIQRLDGLISLCPRCHKVKHFGLSSIRGEAEMCYKHLMKVNGMNRWEAEKYVKECFGIWRMRSMKNWELDISLLKDLLG